jgi:hypothetical protein
MSDNSVVSDTGDSERYGFQHEGYGFQRGEMFPVWGMFVRQLD